MKEYRMILPLEGRLTPVYLSIDEYRVSYTFAKDGTLRTESLSSNKILASEVITQSDVTTLKVHYVFVAVNKGHQISLNIKSLDFQGKNNDCLNLSATIREIIQTQEIHRPTRLLIIINPSSGSANSVKMYNKEMAPVFDLCGIVVTKIVTKNAEDVRRTCNDFDLSSLDGILIMGGDGTMNLVINTLMGRLSRESLASTDLDNFEVIKPRLTLGLIPGGTGNCVSFFLNGSSDIKTSAINVALGNKTSIDLIAIHNHRELLGYALLEFSIGVFPAAHVLLEKIRNWATSKRHMFLLPFMYWCFQRYHMTIDYLTQSPNYIDEINGCDRNEPSDDAFIFVNSEDENSDEINKITGNYSTVHCLPWAFKDFWREVLDKSYVEMNSSPGNMYVLLFESDSYIDTMKAYANIVANRPVSSGVMRICPMNELNLRVEVDNDGVAIHTDAEPTYLTNDVDLHIKVFPRAVPVFCINREMVSDALKESSL